MLVEAVTEIDQLLRQPDRERRVRRDHGCEAGRRREVLAGRHDLAHQPEGERFLGADHAAGHEKLLRPRVADRAHQPRHPRHTDRRHTSQLKTRCA